MLDWNFWYFERGNSLLGRNPVFVEVCTKIWPKKPDYFYNLFINNEVCLLLESDMTILYFMHQIFLHLANKNYFEPHKRKKKHYI